MRSDQAQFGDSAFRSSVFWIQYKVHTLIGLMGQEKGVSNALEWIFHRKSCYASTFDAWR